MISVITITYNNYDELIATLNSIPRSEFIQSVVINGGSCERTKLYLQSYQGVILCEPDRGISDAFNKGLHLSTGNYITFLNSGDLLIDKLYYLKCLDLFSNNLDIDFIYAAIEFHHPTSGKHIYHPAGTKMGDMPFPHPSLIVKKSVFEKVGGFSEDYKMAMDYDFAYRMLSLKFKGYYYTESVVVKMDGNGISSNSTIQGLEERTSILKNNNSFTIMIFLQFSILRIKYYVRFFLAKIKLLSLYDRLRGRF